MRFFVLTLAILTLCACATVPDVVIPPAQPMFSGLAGAELVQEQPGQPLTGTNNKNLAFIASRNTEGQLNALGQCISAGSANFQNQRHFAMALNPLMILMEPWANSIDKDASNFGAPAAWATLASHSVAPHFHEVSTVNDFPSALVNPSIDLIGVIDISLGGCDTQNGAPPAIRFKIAFIDRDLTVQCMVDRSVTIREAYRASGANMLTVTSTSNLRGYTVEFNRSLDRCIPGAGASVSEDADRLRTFSTTGSG